MTIYPGGKKQVPHSCWSLIYNGNHYFLGNNNFDFCIIEYFQFLDIGHVASLELNNKPVDTARKGQEVCVKIEPISGDSPKMFGRHFDHTDLLYSKVGIWCLLYRAHFYLRDQKIVSYFNMLKSKSGTSLFLSNSLKLWRKYENIWYENLGKCMESWKMWSLDYIISEKEFLYACLLRWDILWYTCVHLLFTQ